MANHLDLEEQEQLDQIKHFWKQYGNIITWALIAVLGSISAWNGYQWWVRNQSIKAAALFEEVERFSRSSDLEKMERAFGDMKSQFPSTLYAQQAGLLLAKDAYTSGKVDTAKAALTWVSEKSPDRGYVDVARLRLAGVLIEAKAYEDALRVLSHDVSDEFLALVADRRGDIYMSQGKVAQAQAEYQKAADHFEDRSDYRRIVDVKLSALGGGEKISKAAIKTEGAK